MVVIALIEIKKSHNEVEENFMKMFDGYRTEPGKTFTFRVWTEAEYLKKVKPNGSKLIE